MTVKDVAERALDYLFPPRCMICLDIIPPNAPERLCPECDDLLEMIVSPCARCGVPSEAALCAECSGRPARDGLDGNRALFVYDEPVKKMIHNLKYGSRPEIARGLGRYVKDGGFGDYFSSADYLTFVPLHRNRAMRRGYNQAELIAREISSVTGVPVMNALARKKDTAPQAGLDYYSRLNNLRGAFAAVDRGAASKKFIIVDDIYTTGATLNACAEALKSRGAAGVKGFTAAVAIAGKKI